MCWVTPLSLIYTFPWCWQFSAPSRVLPPWDTSQCNSPPYHWGLFVRRGPMRHLVCLLATVNNGGRGGKGVFSELELIDNNKCFNCVVQKTICWGGRAFAPPRLTSPPLDPLKTTPEQHHQTLKMASKETGHANCGVDATQSCNSQRSWFQLPCVNMLWFSSLVSITLHAIYWVEFSPSMELQNRYKYPNILKQSLNFQLWLHFQFVRGEVILILSELSP